MRPSVFVCCATALQSSRDCSAYSRPKCLQSLEMAPAQSKAAHELLDVKCSTDHQPSNFMKAAKRFKAIITTYAERDEPVPIQAWKVLPSPKNRLGAPLNLGYVHSDLGPNIHKKGYDATRPKPGVVVHRTSPQKIQALKAHAEAMISGAPHMFPTYHFASPEVCFECVGGNHLTVVIRFYEAGYTSPVTNIKYVVPDDEEDLRDRVNRGHSYIVLRDDVPEDDLTFLSEYLNSDQDQNQCTSEVSSLSAVNKALLEELKVTPHPKVGKIVQTVSALSMIKLKADSIGDLAHYCANLANTPYVTEIINWHSRNVNPKEISISPRWLGDIAKTLGKSCPIVLKTMPLIQWRGELKLEQVRPLPDIARTIGMPEVNAQMKGTSNIEFCETFCGDSRRMLEMFLNKQVGEPMANALFNDFEEAAVRLLFSKSLGVVKFEHSVAGKFTNAKLESLRHSWLPHIENNYDQLCGLRVKFGIVDMHAADAEKPDDEVHAHGHWEYFGKELMSRVQSILNSQRWVPTQWDA